MAYFKLLGMMLMVCFSSSPSTAIVCDQRINGGTGSNIHLSAICFPNGTVEFEWAPVSESSILGNLQIDYTCTFDDGNTTITKDALTGYASIASSSLLTFNNWNEDSSCLFHGCYVYNKASENYPTLEIPTATCTVPVKRTSTNPSPTAVPILYHTSAVPMETSNTAIMNNYTSISSMVSLLHPAVTQSHTTSTVTQSQTTSTVIQSQTTSTVTQSHTTSTVTQSQTTNTVTQSHTTSTVTQSQTTSTVTQSQTTSTVTQSQAMRNYSNQSIILISPDSEDLDQNDYRLLLGLVGSIVAFSLFVVLPITVILCRTHLDKNKSTLPKHMRDINDIYTKKCQPLCDEEPISSEPQVEQANCKKDTISQHNIIHPVREGNSKSDIPDSESEEEVWLGDQMYNNTSEDFSNVMDDCQTNSMTSRELYPLDLIRDMSIEDRLTSPGIVSPGYVPSYPYNSNQHGQSGVPTYPYNSEQSEVATADEILSIEQGSDPQFAPPTCNSSSCSIVGQPCDHSSTIICTAPEGPEQSCAYPSNYRVIDRELISPTHSDGDYVTVTR